jgi:hypothetical protein
MLEQQPLPPDVKVAYDNYVRSHFGDVSDTLGLAETLYNAGARNALAASVAFSDILPQLRRLEVRIHLLADALERAVA